MTLYEFNRLNKEEQISTVYSKRIFIDNHISKTETLNCYAINLFFAESIYDVHKNKIVEVRSFKSRHLLNKYSSNFKIFCKR